MIKPIETIYKGYRFRSRLEARWAVFFDDLEEEWEYEKEGFEVDGERYLPDFYLPEKDLWVEIKPLIGGILGEYSKGKVYLVGKIANDSWRSDLVKDNKTLGNLDYVGPYYTPLHLHEGNHGEKQQVYCGHDNYDIHNHVLYEDYDYSRQCWIKDNSDNVFNRCLSQIREADFIFAWIDTVDCYGSMFELGYAHAKNKIIVGGFGNWLMPENYASSHPDDVKQKSDFWFLQKSFNNFGYYPDVVTAFLDQTSWLKNIPAKIINFSKQNNILYLCGSPGIDQPCYLLSPPRHESDEPRREFKKIQDIFPYRDVVCAINKAKQARFEHGERG